MRWRGSHSIRNTCAGPVEEEGASLFGRFSKRGKTLLQKSFVLKKKERKKKEAEKRREKEM
jgi:hypothetical protein